MKSYISRKFPLETRTTAPNFDMCTPLWDISLRLPGLWHITSAMEMKMKTTCRTHRTAALAVVALLLSAPAFADEVKVITSGAFTAAYLQLAPEFEHTTRHTIVTTFGASMGNGPNTIPSRLQRGEAADVVILAASALDELIKQGRVVAGSRVDLIRSRIGMAVRTGARKPDISSIDALKQVLLHAESVAVSGSASGVYLSTELFQRMGIAEQMKGKIKVSEEAVGLDV